MKKLIYLMVMTMLIGFTTSETFAQKKGNKVVCFKSDMDCGDCEKSIIEYVKYEKGVKDLKADHISNTIMVEYKDGKNTNENLAEAIKKKGYKADVISKDEYEKLIAKEATQGHVHNHAPHKERN